MWSWLLVALQLLAALAKWFTSSKDKELKAAGRNEAELEAAKATLSRVEKKDAILAKPIADSDRNAFLYDSAPSDTEVGAVPSGPADPDQPK